MSEDNKEKRYNLLDLDTNVYGKFTPNAPFYLPDAIYDMFPNSDITRRVYHWLIRSCQLETFLVKGSTELKWVEIGSYSLSYELGHCTSKSIQRSLKFLEDGGWIECQRQGKGRVNKYRVILPLLLEAIKDRRDRLQGVKLTKGKIDQAYETQTNQLIELSKSKKT